MLLLAYYFNTFIRTPFSREDLNMNIVKDVAQNMLLPIGNPGRRTRGEPSSASSGYKKKAPGDRPGRVSPQEAQK
jgi:hypothetical protein